jgi:pyruvate,water dikinase
MAEKRFLYPHEVEQIPGTEGWERMYPYYYRWATDKDPDKKNYEKSQLWYYDGLHYPEPHYPFDLIWDEAWYLALSQYNNRIFIVPPAKGIDHRMVNGYVYITPIGIADPKEIEARVPHFMERAGHYYQNWDKIWEEWVPKTEALIEELESIEFKDLPEMEDISVVLDHKGISSGYELRVKYDELINLGFKVWQYHFEMLNLGYAAYVTFMNLANQIFPDIPLHVVTKMVSGIDVVMYKPDAELIRLAKLGMELNLTEILMDKDLDFEATKAKLEQSDNGKKWLEEWEKARHPWFYVSTGTGWYHTHKSWNDDLNVPLSSLRMHIAELQKGNDPSRPTEKLAKEREELIEKYLALIKNENDRKAFEESLRLSQTVFPYVENHLFYVEHWFHSIFWNKVRELAQILVNHGFINDVEDIWFMNRFDIKVALDDLTSAWASGVVPAGRSYWPDEIKWRKEVYEKFTKWTPPPALGTPPDVVTEPFSIVLWGVTTDSLKNWLKALDTDEGGEVTELHGCPGSSGVVKGKARIIKKVEDLDELQDGEILVAPTTSPSWAPAFTKIAGAVTDVGGAMCHAAIVCREYSLPTVVGTGTGTTAIKTGDLIELDGDEGIVKIIERA